MGRNVIVRVTPTPSPCKHPVSPPCPMIRIPCQERFGPLVVHDLHLVPSGMGYSSSSRTDVARFLGTLCMNSLYSRHSSLGERFRVSTGATGRSVFNCRYIPLVVGISIKREILDRTSVDGRSEVKDKLLNMYKRHLHFHVLTLHRNATF